MNKQKQYMKKLFLTLILSAIKLCYANEPLIIEKQGSFSAGGKIVQRDDKYDNSKFVGWAEQNEVGQSYRADHAFINYQIPVNANKYQLVFIHGYGGSGLCCEMTPDLSNHKQDIPAINSIMDKIDGGILITHSASSYPGWVVAMENKNVKTVASFEPGSFVFSEDEVPEPISWYSSKSR